MDRVIVIPVTELSSATYTRARGDEAFNALIERVRGIGDEASAVLIDISSAKMLSGSFLDELILRLSRRTERRPDIGFRVGSPEEISRLERVCSVRQVACIYQLGTDAHLRKTHIRRRTDMKVEDHPGSFFES